jgi:hypothetical protein
MTGLWDSVLNNTAAYDRAAPRVVSEVHDSGTINWVAGLTDPGEMIRCGMYQVLRRMDGETDADYAARLPALLAALSRPTPSLDVHCWSTTDDRNRPARRVLPTVPGRAGRDAYQLHRRRVRPAR